MQEAELYVTQTGPGFIRRPIVGIAIAFVTGTALGLWYAQQGGWAFFIAVVLLFAALILHAMSSRALKSHDPSKALQFLTMATICGCTLFVAWSAASMERGDLGQVAIPASIQSSEKIQLEGCIVDYPQPLSSRIPGMNSWLLHFQIQRVRPSREKWTSLNQEVRVFWNARSGTRKPRYGDVWKLRSIRGPDLLAEDAEKGWLGTLRVYGRQTRYVSGGHGSKIRAWRYEARARAAEHLQIGIKDFPVEANIFQALLLGYRSRLPKEIKELGAATGTMHIFAVSGLHVGLIAGLLIGALSALRISRVHWIYFLAPMLIIYTLLTGARPSAVRACIMAIIYFMAPAIGRRADGPSALSMAAIVILAWDPNQLKDIGFIYSFVVVIGLITLYPLFWDAMKPMWKTDRMRAQEETWRKCLMGCSKYIMGLLAISCAAWLTSMPLTAYYFGRFTPIAILGNLAVIPLAFMIVLGGCLSFVLGSLLDVMAEIFNHAALLAIKMFMVSIDAFSRVPFSSAEVPRPSLTWVVLWYVVLSAVAFILWQRRRGKSMDTRSRR